MTHLWVRHVWWHLADSANPAMVLQLQTVQKGAFTCTLVYLVLFFCSINKKENTCLQLKSNSGATGRVTINRMYCLGSKLISSALFNECPKSCLSKFLFPLYTWCRPEAQSLFFWCHRWGHRAYCSARKWWADSFLERGSVLCSTSAKSKSGKAGSVDVSWCWVWPKFWNRVRSVGVNFWCWTEFWVSSCWRSLCFSYSLSAHRDENGHSSPEADNKTMLTSFPLACPLLDV